MSIRLAILGVCVAAGSLHAEPSGFSLAPHVGVTSEGAFADGPAIFSDGDIDYILVEPGAATLLGLELGYRFSNQLEGTLALSYAMSEARFIEKDELRRDVDFDTLRIQPGVLYRVVDAAKVAVDVGGGLTIARISIDGMVWSDRPIAPSVTGLGLFGSAGLDIPLTDRLAFHSHLNLEATRPFYGSFEDDLARADGEAGVEIDHDLRLGLVFAIGLRIGI